MTHVFYPTFGQRDQRREDQPIGWFCPRKKSIRGFPKVDLHPIPRRWPKWASKGSAQLIKRVFFDQKTEEPQEHRVPAVLVSPCSCLRKRQLRKDVAILTIIDQGG